MHFFGDSVRSVEWRQMILGYDPYERREERFGHISEKQIRERESQRDFFRRRNRYGSPLKIQAPVAKT